MHEGLDIRCLQRDKHGEPIDPVMATADGIVAYINRRSGLSNFGNYVVLKHQIDGIELYSVYAHLSEVLPGLRIGQVVKAGEQIAVMGRTSNTHERITKERAHVHFELDLLANDNYASWHKKFLPSQRNDHGEWNGQNLLGIDPREVLLRQNASRDKFNLVTFLLSEPELCRVFVRKTNFSWIRRYPALVLKNPVAEKNGVVGYELALDFNGVPLRAIPRSAAEIKGGARFQLLAVNEAEAAKNPCRHLVTRRGSSWQLTHHGDELLELLTY
jgi:murein DD-endopeptidase MepM/ murein hydrolase activator NlpD